LSLEGHGPEWEESEKPALEQLIKMGYRYETQKELDQKRTKQDGGFGEPIIIDIFKKQIQKLNPWLDEDGIQEVLAKLKKTETEVQLDGNEITHAKIVGRSRANLEPITVTMDQGDGIRPYTVKIIDFENVENNDWLVTNQFNLWGYSGTILPDVMTFVNGIPLALIECKSPFITNPMHEAISDNISRYQKAGTGFDKMYDYVQFNVATSGTQARYATPFAPENLFIEWNDPYPLSSDDVKNEIGRARKQEVLIAGMLAKENFLTLIRDCTVFETVNDKRIKKIAKYQQFRAIQKALKKYGSGTIPSEKGGVVWHTQGSGKSLNMVMLAIQMKRKFQNPTILIVTDRKQLDRQIHDTFKSCGFPNPVRAQNKDKLKELISGNKGKTIMTTIFKFPFFENEDPHTVSEEEVIILIDEAHRTQSGLTHADMRAALPNATFIGYTGTPLLKKSKKMTVEIFGDYIDKYTIAESERDGATVPIYYESRAIPTHVGNQSLDKVFDRITQGVDDETKTLAKRKYANKTAIASAPERIKQVTLDLLEHYENTIRPNGLKAMIVAPSREAAVLYKEELDKLNAPESRIIMSSMPEDQTKGWDKYELSASDRERYAERFKRPLEDEGLSILIVVDMLLTGFDAPILGVMYLDQGLKEHGILQAIARVNRPYKKIKEHGLIVDYWGISKNLADALEMYDDTDIENIVRPLDDAKHNLKLRYAQAMSHFVNIEKNDLDAHLEYLLPDDVREKFNQDYRNLSKMMEIVLPDPDAIKYRKDFSHLSKIRMAARNKFMDENLDLRYVGEKVKKLITESLNAEEAEQLIAPAKIDRKNFFKNLEDHKSNKVKASMMEATGVKVIQEKKPKDPKKYESLRFRLEELMEELRATKFEDAKSFKTLQDFMEKFLTENEEDEKLDANTRTVIAIFNILKDLEVDGKEISKKIFDDVKPKLVVGWSKDESVQASIRAGIKSILSSTGIEYEIADSLAIEILDVIRANLGHE
jgi:type I restriction enzyme R subunit